MSSSDLRFPASRDGASLDPPTDYVETLKADGLQRATLWNDQSVWLVTRHAHVREVLSDERISANNLTAGFPFNSEAAAAVASANHSFLRMDEPDHQRMRKMIAGFFRVRSVTELTQDIQDAIDGLIGAMTQDGRSQGEFVSQFALPLPSLVICMLLGVPYEDHDFFQDRSRVLLNRSLSGETVAAANDELKDYLGKLAESKKSSPDGGVLSHLVEKFEATGEISRAQVVQTARLLLVAGHETTANQLTLSVFSILRDRNLFEELRRDQELIPGAVDELLRYVSVIHSGLGRLAVADLQIGETQVKAGDGLVCMVNIGNRDTSEFECPDAIDVHRDARRHLAFGYGIHHCLGQPLARHELQLALRTLISRFPQFRLGCAEDAVEFCEDNIVFGVKALPVAW